MTLGNDTRPYWVCLFLPLLATLPVINVPSSLCQHSQKIIAKMAIKARREKTKADVPKFSPTVVNQGKNTELQKKGFSCNSQQKMIKNKKHRKKATIQQAWKAKAERRTAESKQTTHLSCAWRRYRLCGFEKSGSRQR